MSLRFPPPFDFYSPLPNHPHPIRLPLSQTSFSFPPAGILLINLSPFPSLRTPPNPFTPSDKGYNFLLPILSSFVLPLPTNFAFSPIYCNIPFSNLLNYLMFFCGPFSGPPMLFPPFAPLSLHIHRPTIQRHSPLKLYPYETFPRHYNSPTSSPRSPFFPSRLCAFGPLFTQRTSQRQEFMPFEKYKYQSQPLPPLSSFPLPPPAARHPTPRKTGDPLTPLFQF